jgi:hypothetical protein
MQREISHDLVVVNVAKNEGRIFCGATMARKAARFRISIKDNATGAKLVVELLPFPWSGRFAIRQNGRRARRVASASTSAIFARLRSWVARQARLPV